MDGELNEATAEEIETAQGLVAARFPQWDVILVSLVADAILDADRVTASHRELRDHYQRLRAQPPMSPVTVNPPVLEFAVRPPNSPLSPFRRVLVAPNDRLLIGWDT